MKLADNLNDHLPVTYSEFILLSPTPTIDAEPKEPQTLISILKRGRAPCMSDRPLNLTKINSWYYFMMVLLMMKEANTMETMERSFIRMLMEGPDVSLKGSPTVSPTTAAL